GRVSLNVVSSWWAEEARKFGVHFEQHDDRYARTSEWLDIVDTAWKSDHFSYSGKYYSVQDTVVQPKPVAKPRPTIYAGGESDTAIISSGSRIRSSNSVYRSRTTLSRIAACARD